jgi:hypothetical protein
MHAYFLLLVQRVTSNRPVLCLKQTRSSYISYERKIVEVGCFCRPGRPKLRFSLSPDLPLLAGARWVCWFSLSSFSRACPNRPVLFLKQKHNSYSSYERKFFEVGCFCSPSQLCRALRESPPRRFESATSKCFRSYLM